MRALCDFLYIVTNPLIFAVATLELFFMIMATINLVRLKIRITKLNGKRVIRRGKTRKISTGSMVTKTEIESAQNWDDFDTFLEDYQKNSWWYSTFTLVIQLFTLLGILGTVAGLYIAMGDDDMYVGVELALSTTVLGILFAIIYKIADVIIVSFLVNYIEDGIDRYESTYKIKNDEVKCSSGGAIEDSVV